MAQSPFVLTFDVFILLLSIVQTKKLAGRPSCMVTLQVLEVTCNKEPASPGQTPIMERHPTNSICCGQTTCTPSTTYKNGSQSRFYNGIYSINENNKKDTQKRLTYPPITKFRTISAKTDNVRALLNKSFHGVIYVILPGYDFL